MPTKKQIIKKIYEILAESKSINEACYEWSEFVHFYGDINK